MTILISPLLTMLAYWSHQNLFGCNRDVLLVLLGVRVSDLGSKFLPTSMISMRLGHGAKHVLRTSLDGGTKLCCQLLS